MKIEQKVLELAQQLISIKSITPHDHGCQDILAERLQKSGFKITRIKSGNVDNLIAIYGGSNHNIESDKSPLLAFAGHTDVVDEGEVSDWYFPPYAATVKDGVLHGRGAQDMKGAIAAMVVAAEEFAAANPLLNAENTATAQRGRLGLFITSGEEGHDYLDGTPKMLEHLHAHNDKITWCVVGEPSSDTKLGDTIRNGRRGSLKAFLTIKGKQGHVAYPELALNPIHATADFLRELVRIEWCKGNEFFPPTVMQCANICSNTSSVNIIPGELKLWVAFRYSSAITHQEIRNRFEKLLAAHNVPHELTWELSGEPFLTKPGELIAAVEDVLQRQLSIKPTLSTGGGTSDARFIATTGAEVIELGTTNDKIHQINEAVEVTELGQLCGLYQGIADKLLLAKN